MATSKIAAWSTSLTPTSIPPSTYEAALHSLYNYLGCTLHGSSHPTVHRALSAIQTLTTTINNGPPHSGPSLLGTPRKLSAEHAALLNGIASHVHDYDDTHLATIIHPTGPIASALIAHIQSLPPSTPISGPTLLTALIIGIEVSCKLGLSVWPHHYDIGWHITSTTGSIGAAAAVSKLLGLSALQTTHALGIAATQATGLRCNFGSDTKSFHVGRAAANGLLAAHLAAAGFTADEHSLEARRGWANVVVGGKPDEVSLDTYTDQLGTIWETERNSFKPFPCGIVAHPGIDAAVRMRREIANGTENDDDDDAAIQKRIAGLRFTARVHPLVVELTNNRTPRDGLEAKFSVFHGVAVGLLYGKAGPAQYDDSVVTDPTVVQVRDRIAVHADEKMASDATVLTASEGDAKTPVFEVRVDHAVGSLGVPMSQDQLREKFVDQVALDFGRERAGKMSELCWTIGDVDDVRTVLDRLSPGNE